MMKKLLLAGAIILASFTASAGVVCNSCDYVQGQQATNLGLHSPLLEDNSTFSNATTGTNGDFSNWWIFEVNPSGSASINAIFLPVGNISNFAVSLFGLNSQVCAANTATTGGACTSFAIGSLVASGDTNPAFATVIDFTVLDAGFYAFNIIGTISNLGATQPASYTGNLQVEPLAVPEPASLALLGVAMLGLGFNRKALVSRK
jgi:hypothetical protein